MRAGVYRIEDPASPVSIMCDRAVIALRTVKGSYFDRVALYDPGMREALVLEREVVAGVESALREDRIELFLQPKCNIRTGKIVGAEALARWRHPERGIVAPGEFIPLIERNGLVRSLDPVSYTHLRVPKYPLRGLPSGRASSSPSPRSRAPRKPSLTLLDQR